MGHVGLFVERDEDGDWFVECRQCGYFMVWKSKERMRYLSVPVYGAVPANAVRTRMEFGLLWADLPNPGFDKVPEYPEWRWAEWPGTKLVP
jgi:hypothetical protein